MIVSGYVFDNEMKALPNVNISVLGENKNVVSSKNGFFSIEVNSVFSQLRFDLLGYDYDTISVLDFQQLGYIELFPSTTELGEATVINNAKSDNTLAWVLGIATVLGLGYLLTSKNEKAVNVKA